MAYSFRLLPIILSPFGNTPVSAELVHGITQIEPGDRLVITEDVAELTGRDTLGGQVDFGTYGPAPTPPASRIGIRIFRRNAGLQGPLFRSGFLGSLPPPTTAPLPELEVVEAPWFLLDERTLNDTLRSSLPRTVDGTTINSASVVIEEGTVRVRAQGTRPGGPLGTIGFTVNGPFAAVPVSTMSPVEDGAQALVVFSATENPQVQLTGSGPSIPEAQAIIALLQSLAGPWIASAMGGAITTMINSQAPQLIGRELNRQFGGPSVLPASITCSVERVVVGTLRTTPGADPTFGVHILASLGSFSGVIATLFPSSGSRGCSAVALALATAPTALAAVMALRRRSVG